MKTYLKWLAIAGNSVFFLWVLVNGINDGFQGTFVEKVSYIVLMCLLVTNVFLLLGSKAKANA